MFNFKPKISKVILAARKFKNSYCFPRTWMYTFGIFDEPVGKIFEDFIIARETNRENTFLRKVEVRVFDLLSKYIFIPTSTNYLVWYLRDNPGEVKYPSDFKKLDTRSSLYLNRILHYTSKDGSVLDVGCNCGRHLNVLADNGYKSLSGIDISKNALALMSKWFPKLKDLGTFHHTTFGSYFVNCSTDSFDLVMSYGATIENCNPSFDIVGNMCRAAKSYVIVNLGIDGHSYPRMWQREFEKNGFRLVEQTSCENNGIRAPTLVFEAVKKSLLR